MDECCMKINEIPCAEHDVDILVYPKNNIPYT